MHGPERPLSTDTAPSLEARRLFFFSLFVFSSWPHCGASRRLRPHSPLHHKSSRLWTCVTHLLGGPGLRPPQRRYCVSKAPTSLCKCRPTSGHVYCVKAYPRSTEDGRIKGARVSMTPPPSNTDLAPFVSLSRPPSGTPHSVLAARTKRSYTSPPLILPPPRLRRPGAGPPRAHGSPWHCHEKTPSPVLQHGSGGRIAGIARLPRSSRPNVTLDTHPQRVPHIRENKPGGTLTGLRPWAREDYGIYV